MPYLKLAVPGRYPADVKRAAATVIVALYAGAMGTTPARVTVGFRELGGRSLWTAQGGGVEPGAVVMCDARAGRRTGVRSSPAG
jgi:hypothetical protein